jgi:hypothetical protein
LGGTPVAALPGVDLTLASLPFLGLCPPPLAFGTFASSSPMRFSRLDFCDRRYGFLRAPESCSTKSCWKALLRQGGTVFGL